ncbi:MAG: GNAT family N-acetyltransferase [Thermodesulfobacteriota bacterium]
MSSVSSRVLVHKVYSGDFDRVYASLLAAHDPRLDKEDWRQLFIKHWETPEDYHGFMLVDNEEVVGFLGTIFSRRKSQGKDYRYCNLSSWIVKPEHRNKSLLLLLALLKLTDYTFTNLSALEHVAVIHQKLGFTDMGSQAQILLPIGGFSWGAPNKPRLILEPERIKDRLKGDARIIFDDHISFKCKHILFEADNNYCYLIASKLVKKGIPILYVHYISNLALFLNLIHKVVFKVLYHFKALGLLIDDRFLAGLNLRWALKYKLPHYKLLKSPFLQAQDIDNLYSEKILLNF